MMPPIHRWGRIIKEGKSWTSAPVMIEKTGDGYRLRRQSGGMVPGTFKIIDVDGGFRVMIKNGSLSGLCRWQEVGS